MRLRSSSCATSLIVTNRSRDSSVGERQTEDLKVSSSAPASYRAPVGAAPDFQRAHCSCNLSGSGVSFVVDDFTVLVFPGLIINHWLSLCGHIQSLRASSSVCKNVPESSNCDSKLAGLEEVECNFQKICVANCFDTSPEFGL